MIAVIDSGVANTASVLGALQRLGADAVLTQDPADIRGADRVIFPGVGSAAAAMARLNDSGLAALLPRLTAPVLGICLGMQLLYTSSQENGGTPGLGVFPGEVRRLQPVDDSPVPHMGWTTVNIRQTAHPLFAGLDDNSFFYFVHSFAAPASPLLMAEAAYGGQGFTAVAGQRNFFGCQFHPERSSAAGARLLKNFLEL